MLVGSDGSTDETEAIVTAWRRATRGSGCSRCRRSGQTSTQAALFAAARGEVVVLTDAETRFAPGCLAALAEALRDPRVGCVTGRLEWRDEAATATSTQEGLYWRYERRVRELESRAGLLTAVTGALLAVRRVRVSGGAAVGVDGPPPAALRPRGRRAGRLRPGRRRHGPADQRPARAAPQPDPDGDARHPREPVDGRGAGAVAAARSGRGDLVAQAAALGDAVVRRRRGGRGSVSSAWAAQPVYLRGAARRRRGLALTAAAGHLLIGAGRHPWRAVTFVRSFAVVNIAFAIGWLNVIRGREIEVWHRAEWRAEN